MLLVSWNVLMGWDGFCSSVFGVWSICMVGDPCTMVGT